MKKQKPVVQGVKVSIKGKKNMTVPLVPDTSYEARYVNGYFYLFRYFIFPFYRPPLRLRDDRSSHTPIQGAAMFFS